MSKIELYTFDDWEVLMVNGEIVTQDHSLRASEVLHALDVDFTSKFIEEGQDPDIDECLYDGDIEGVLEIVRNQ